MEKMEDLRRWFEQSRGWFRRLRSWGVGDVLLLVDMRAGRRWIQEMGCRKGEERHGENME